MKMAEPESDVLLGLCDDFLCADDEISNNWWLNKVGGKPVCCNYVQPVVSQQC